MEFDKSRVYTAVNADELKIGSKVIVAYNFGILKNTVLSTRLGYSFEGDVLQDVKSEFEDTRFVMGNGRSFPFAYLVEEPEEKKLKWTDLKIGDVIKRGDELRMVTGIQPSVIDKMHIYAGAFWIEDEELEEWEKVDLELEEYERRVEE